MSGRRRRSGPGPGAGHQGLSPVCFQPRLLSGGPGCRGAGLLSPGSAKVPSRNVAGGVREPRARFTPIAGPGSRRAREPSRQLVQLEATLVLPFRDPLLL